jgi:hypothetical protein
MIISDETMTCYENYSKITGKDLITFMKTKNRHEIDEFKQFCNTPKITRYKDGTTTEHKTTFFEMRNWVLDKYYPGLRDQKKTSVTKTLFDEIMEL